MNQSRSHALRWTRPWGKHTPAKYKQQHATEKAQAIAKDDVLPIVTIRHPLRWMQSMCHNPYTAKWKHSPQNCPHLQIDDEWNPVHVKYGAATENYTSLAHLYNEWYHEYQNSDYPVLMIRMEDLVFFTQQTISQVCECAGGRSPPRPFQYVLDSAKADSPGHDVSTGLLEAFVKYGKALPPKMEGLWSDRDYQDALEAIDPNLLDTFHY